MIKQEAEILLFWRILEEKEVIVMSDNSTQMQKGGRQ